MTDSPYYNKTLFPGQIYDWYEAGLHLVGQPNTDDCAFCYWLNSKKREMMFEKIRFLGKYFWIHYLSIHHFK